MKKPPKETIARWKIEAQSRSMKCWGEVDSEYVGMYVDVKKEGWLRAERDKNAFNQMYLTTSKLVEQKDKKIKKLENQIKRLKAAKK